jgi:hypothetical protein
MDTGLSAKRDLRVPRFMQMERPSWIGVTHRRSDRPKKKGAIGALLFELNGSENDNHAPVQRSAARSLVVRLRVALTVPTNPHFFLPDTSCGQK